MLRLQVAGHGSKLVPSSNLLEEEVGAVAASRSGKFAENAKAGFMQVRPTGRSSGETTSGCLHRELGPATWRSDVELHLRD